MVPPEMKDGRFPVILYNFGGVIMNLLSSAVFLGLYFLLKVFSRRCTFCGFFGFSSP